jgi:hypothetical protein
MIVARIRSSGHGRVILRLWQHDSWEEAAVADRCGWLGWEQQPWQGGLAAAAKAAALQRRQMLAPPSAAEQAHG